VIDTYEEDDPVESALFAYSRAFESEGDAEAAEAFDIFGISTPSSNPVLQRADMSGTRAHP
jgi:hypothetical protein